MKPDQFFSMIVGISITQCNWALTTVDYKCFVFGVVTLMIVRAWYLWRSGIWQNTDSRA